MRITSGEGLQGCSRMSMNFRALAFDARSRPLANSLFIPHHTYLVVMRLCVSRMLGCDSVGRWSKIVHWNWTGTTGLSLTVDVSQVNRVPETGREMSLRLKEFGVAHNLDSSRSSR